MQYNMRHILLLIIGIFLLTISATASTNPFGTAENHNGEGVISNIYTATVTANQSQDLIMVKVATPRAYSTVGQNILHTPTL